jgi:hypothetical protein
MPVEEWEPSPRPLLAGRHGVADAGDAGGLGSAAESRGGAGGKPDAELEKLRAALAEAEEVLRHRVIGLEQYLKALAEADSPTVAVVSQRDQVEPRRAVPHRDDAARVEMVMRWTTRR